MERCDDSYGLIGEAAQNALTYARLPFEPAGNISRLLLWNDFSTLGVAVARGRHAPGFVPREDRDAAHRDGLTVPLSAPSRGVAAALRCLRDRQSRCPRPAGSYCLWSSRPAWIEGVADAVARRPMRNRGRAFGLGRRRLPNGVARRVTASRPVSRTAPARPSGGSRCQSSTLRSPRSTKTKAAFDYRVQNPVALAFAHRSPRKVTPSSSITISRGSPRRSSSTIASDIGIPVVAVSGCLSA